MALPGNVNLVRVRGYLFNQDGSGASQLNVTFRPPSQILLTDPSANSYIKLSQLVVTPDSATGYFFADLVATNDPNLDPTAWTCSIPGQPVLTIAVPHDSPTVDVGGGVMMQALWLTDAATITVPTPAATYYTSSQVDAAIDAKVASSGVTSVNTRIGAITLASSDVGLGNVDNTSDVNKPVSTASATALTGKAAVVHTHTPSNVGLANVDNTSDVNKPVSSAAATALSGKAAVAHTHVTSDVGLGNADNTSDVNKPVSTATATALTGKAAVVHSHPETLNTADVGYDLILLWGQSNMSGRGVPFDTTRYDPSDPRIQQWGASGTYAAVVSQAVEPLAMKDVPSGIGPGLVFARWYLHSTPLNRRVLLVPSALGGTQLSTASTTGWRRGVAGGLYAQAVAQAQAALAAAGANARITAILWIQGETDGDNGISGSSYQTDLDALITGARTDLGVATLPFVMGQMVPEYLATGTRAAINTIHLATPSRVTGVRVAPGVYLNNNNDGNHYNGIAQRVMGRAMFDAYQRILTGASDPAPPAVPGQVTGLATSAVGATGLTLTWSAASGAGSYNVQQKTTAGPTFASIATTASLTSVVTGLTTGTSYDFRVIAVSTAGPGTASATVSATPANNGLGQPVATSRVYSLRLVVPAYAGSAVKVRRSSDSTTQDIGFSAGALDTASLLTFCGAGDGFIDTWYDQSGNTRNLTQATTTAQPKLVASGVVVTSGGKPAATFDGVDDCVFSTVANLYAAGAASMCAVLSAPTPGTQKRWWAESVSTSSLLQYGLSEPDNNAAGGFTRARPVLSPADQSLTYQGSLSTFNNVIHQLSATDTGTAMAQWLDGAVDLASVAYTRTGGEAARDRFTLGGVTRTTSLSPAAMTFSEAVWWTSVLGTSDRQAAEANQKAFYGTP